MQLRRPYQTRFYKLRPLFVPNRYIRPILAQRLSANLPSRTELGALRLRVCELLRVFLQVVLLGFYDSRKLRAARGPFYFAVLC